MIARTPTLIATFSGLLIFCSAVSCNDHAQSANSGNAVPEQHEAVMHAAAPAAEPSPAPPVSATREPAPIIPDFTFYILRSGIRFTKQDIAKKGNIVFILFDPTCGHCQHEANDIGKHYEELRDINFYFVSMNDPGLMSTFLETWAKPLVGKANVELLYDRNADFINKFHVPSQYPATYVYGANGQLKTYWNGERPTKEIIAAIKE